MTEGSPSGDRVAAVASNPWAGFCLTIASGAIVGVIISIFSGGFAANEKMADRMDEHAKITAGMQVKQQELCDRTTRLETAEVEQRKINAQLLAEVARLKQAMKLD